MKAMIFAAGLGTRLRPLTNDKPKALVELQGQPLLELMIKRLKSFGVKSIIINVHHFAEKIIQFLEEKQYFNIPIAISHEKETLLETGGGLKKASWFFDDGKPFLVCNADIISTIDFKKLYDYHVQHNALATLAVRQRTTSRYLIFNTKQTLCGWTNIKTGEVKMPRTGSRQMQLYGFSGLQVISPALFDYMPEKTVFSTIEVFLKAANHQRIIAYPHQDDIWLDVGKPDSLEQAHLIMGRLKKSYYAHH